MANLKDEARAFSEEWLQDNAALIDEMVRMTVERRLLDAVDTDRRPDA